MVSIDNTNNIEIQSNIYAAILLFFLNQHIKKVSDTIEWTTYLYENLIKTADMAYYGINNNEMDINTSEADEIWRGFTSMIKDDDLLISQSVDAFRAYDKVSEIYCSNKNDLVEFFILLDNEEYNFDLMHELFTVERYLYSIWDGKYLNFHYAPVNDVNRSTLFDYHIAYKKG